MMKQARVFVSITFVGTILTGAVRAQTADDDVRWFKDNGFDSIQFMERCMSIDQYGREYTGPSLPVGAGWTLECTSYSATGWWVMPMQGSTGTRYCVLGELEDLQAEGDQRLWIKIVDDGEHGPAQLEAAASSAITISPVTAFGVANVWPLWLSAHYHTVDVVRDPLDGRACQQLFHVD